MSQADRFVLDIWIPAGCNQQNGFVNYPNSWVTETSEVVPKESYFHRVEGNLPYLEQQKVTIRSTKNIARPVEFDVFDILPFAEELAKDSMLYIYSEYTNNVLTDCLFLRNDGLLEYGSFNSEFVNKYTIAFVQENLLKDEYKSVGSASGIYEPRLNNLISSYAKMEIEEDYDYYNDPYGIVFHVQVQVFRIYQDTKFELVATICAKAGDLNTKWNLEISDTKISDDIKRVSMIQYKLFEMSHLENRDFGLYSKYRIIEPFSK